VETALLAYHREIGASAGRGAYRARWRRRLLEETRRLLARLFNVRKPEQMIFTFNATDALNLAIKGSIGTRGVRRGLDDGTQLHPSAAARSPDRLGIKIIKVKATREGGVDPIDVAKAIERRTRLIALVQLERHGYDPTDRRVEASPGARDSLPG